MVRGGKEEVRGEMEGDREGGRELKPSRREPRKWTGTITNCLVEGRDERGRRGVWEPYEILTGVTRPGGENMGGRRRRRGKEKQQGRRREKKNREEICSNREEN